MALIRCVDLAVGYESPVASDLNFEIKEGDYLCIVGENGAGKSTLMKTLLRLQSPYSGKIEYSEDLKQGALGYLAQQTVVQRDFPASVWEIVLSGCQSKMGLRPFYGKKEKQQALENMERMQIADLAKRCYRELSGGQKQRVMLARALCATDRVLFLDEPVAGLDPKVTLELYQVIGDLNGEGTAIVMISHDTQSAIAYAKTILHVGEEHFFGSKEEYLQSEIGKRFLV